MTQKLNKSGLTPLGHAVLVEPYEPQKKDSLIVMPETVRERTLMIETRAKIIEVGPRAWYEEGGKRAKPGDHVMISQYAGTMAKGPKDGKTYRVVNDRDIFCGLGIED